MMSGNAWVLGDHISGEPIIPMRYLSNKDPRGWLPMLLADLRPEFAEMVGFGDFIVAGRNFGCGSAREQAPLAIKKAGVGAVIAHSFSRMFYRNAFNVGLCLVECETNYIDDMDELELDLENNIVRNISKGVNMEIKPIPKIMRKFLEKGGVVEYFKAHGGFEEIL